MIKNKELKIAGMLKEALELMTSDMLEGSEVNVDVFDIVRAAWCELKALNTREV